MKSRGIERGRCTGEGGRRDENAMTMSVSPTARAFLMALPRATWTGLCGSRTAAGADFVFMPWSRRPAGPGLRPTPAIPGAGVLKTDLLAAIVCSGTGDIPQPGVLAGFFFDIRRAGRQQWDNQIVETSRRFWFSRTITEQE